MLPPVDFQTVECRIAWDGDDPVWEVEIGTHPVDPTQIVGRGPTLAEAAADATAKLRTHAAEGPFYREWGV